MSHSVLIYTALTISFACTCADPSYATAPELMTTRSQVVLFLDDSAIAATENIQRVVHQGEKHSRPVLEPTEPWEGDRVYTMGTVYYDSRTRQFTLWYMGRTMDGGRPRDHLLYAVSTDGVQWNKPAVGIHEFHGGRDNNILLVGIHSPSIVIARDSHGELTYKLMAMKYDVGGYVTAASSDGIEWTLNTPMPAIKGGDNVTLTRDPASGEYMSFHRQGRRVGNHVRRSIFLSRSDDFESWSKPVPVLVPDERDDQAWVTDPKSQRTEFYNMTAARYRSQFLGFLTVCRFEPTSGGVRTPNQSGTDGPIFVELTYSHDGSHWKRLADRPPILSPGPADWDRGMILSLSNPIIHNDEVWIYYTGFNTTHGGPRPPKRSAIGLAKWRLDGFVSLRPRTGNKGIVETHLFHPEKLQLFVNADAERGSLRAELLDKHGQTISGYSRDDCIPVETNQIRTTIQWRNAEMIPDDRAFAIRFYLNDCDLFSFGFGESH